MAPYEALYGRKCRSPVHWNEVGERKILGPEIVEQTVQAIEKIKDSVKKAQDRQKNYQHHSVEEATWEREDDMRSKYPQLFDDEKPAPTTPSINVGVVIRDEHDLNDIHVHAALYDGNNDQSKSFRSYTRVYNAANAFTSLGATLDPRVLNGMGPTSFTIHGELRHRTGSLQPQPGIEASYAQLYIYDPDSALEIRNRRNPILRRDVLKIIQDSLLQVNVFVDKFCQAHAILYHLDSAGHNLPAHLHYNSRTDRRRYNLPTAYEIAIVIPGDGTEVSGMRDIILHFRGNNELMQINECHPAYLPLHYVLLFPYDAWAATEQNRLTYYKLNQGKLRAELYQELSDMDPDYVRPGQIGQRYIGPLEAAWRIFGHPLHAEMPTVIRLALHLPGMHRVIFNPEESLETIQSRAGQQMSTLTGFFAYCAGSEDECPFTYQEFSQHYVWLKSEKRWKSRERGYAIGKMYFASHNCGERFYLRLLLTVVKGPKSFRSLRTIDNVVHDTFKLACVARGLLEDDEEWIQCLKEAAVMKTGYQLRRLFSIILTQCSPLNPCALWNQFSMHICDDLAHKIRTLFAISNPTDAQIEDYGLHLLNQMLHESGKSLIDFPLMPQVIGNWSVVVGNRLIFEHRQLQSEAQQADPQISIDCLNNGQWNAYNTITSSVFQNKGVVFFLNGGAGTGKTFLYNTITLKCRNLGYIVITVASSGIASLLLVGGRTTHSTFSIPLDVLENSNCGLSKQSLQAELFRETKLIIWDEVPMQHRHCVEAVDRTLRDICDSEKPFGGITVVLGGDFRQILPVIPKGVREQIVNASLRHSVLWKHIHILTLDLNMRLNHEGRENANFANFLMEIGTNPQEIVNLPSTIHKWRLYTYLAADKMSGDNEIDPTITNRYPNEYLNSLDPPGLPTFKLELKVGCPIILLRNIAPKDGLCNGTRLMVIRCDTRIIEAQILTGEKFGNLAFIPRISLAPSSSETPFQMTRHQFPVRLAYALTINKSQGQSVKFVGVDLRIPVFSHGQLYVALSRCTSFDRISILLPKDCLDSTTNIVYSEVLL
ncbi:uncharacterized protein LOC127787570 [Diospyros lotus]|uniref:uncharacterized protein LOC127787570 n=1 Tax=Diospyros lotus TaxID=55363 RepID=UPI002258610D|nr:uncharacterized protein LOC127787570 [Diospyros lotus]